MPDRPMDARGEKSPSRRVDTSTEWVLETDGRWRALDPAAEMATLAADAARLAAKNRQIVAECRAKAAAVKRRLRAWRIWRRQLRPHAGCH